MTQITRILELLQPREGATAMELATLGRTVSQHKRMAELRQKGYTITRRPVPGRSYGRYYALGGPCYFAEQGDAEQGDAERLRRLRK